MEIINVKVGSPSQSTNVDIENPSQVKAEIKNITINTGGSSKAVLYSPQELTSEQKQQARANIDAASQKDLQDGVNEALKEAKESGDFNGPAGYTPVKGKDYFDGKDGKDATVKIGTLSDLKELPELKIYQVTQEEYNDWHEAGILDPNALYVTPDSEYLEVTSEDVTSALGYTPAKPSDIPDVDSALSSSSVNPVQNKVVNAELSKKANDFSIELYNGNKGNPNPVRFLRVNYSTCTSEAGVAIKVSMVSGHGNGSSYAFLQDAIIKVTHTGSVSVDNFKYYGASAGTYDGASRQYGDIFWVIDTDNKIVDFYCLMGQYARVQSTPYKRVTYSTGGSIAQYTSASVYSTGDKVWGNNDEFALMKDIPTVSSNTETWTFTLEDGSVVTKEVYVK